MMKEAALHHWQRLSGEQRRLLVGLAIILVLAAVLAVRAIGPSTGAQSSEPSASWSTIWQDLQRIQVATPMSEDVWRGTSAVQVSEARYEDPSWIISGTADDLDAIDRFRLWAGKQGWHVQQANIEASDGFHFSLTFAAPLVRASR